MRYLQRSIVITLIVTAAGLAGLATRAGAQPYEIRQGEATVSFGGDIITSVDHPNSFAIIGQPLVGRISNQNYIIELGLLSICNPPPPFKNIFWIAAAGNWSLPANWSPAEEPDNDDTSTYVVHITNAGGDDVVTLNTGTNITQLNIGSGATLQVVNGTTRTMTFDPSQITNANNFGIMRVLNLDTATRIFQLTDMKLNQIPSSGQPGQMRAIAPNESQKAELRLVNSPIKGGTVIADGPGATVAVLNSADLVVFDAGEFQAINGGNLDILTRVSGAANYLASGSNSEMRLGGAVAGASSIGTGMTGDDVMVEEGGALYIDGLAAGNLTYTATFAGDAVFEASPPGWGSSPPVLSIGPRGQMAAKNITFTGDAGVEFSGGSLIVVSGNWNNKSTGSQFNCEMGAVEMDGPPGDPEQTFELAGQDLGFSDDGFNDNFSLLQLVIGENRMVRFEDMFSNSPPPPVGCSETLYVDELVFGAGAQITVDCGKVYYRTSPPSGGGAGFSVTFDNGGFIAYIGLAGDLNGDGAANASDVPMFIAALQLGMNGNPDAFFRADLNHDGKADGRDIRLFVDAVIP